MSKPELTYAEAKAASRKTGYALTAAQNRSQRRKDANQRARKLLEASAKRAALARADANHIRRMLDLAEKEEVRLAALHTADKDSYASTTSNLADAVKLTTLAAMEVDAARASVEKLTGSAPTE